jgi:SAM-dependent methyltransferase
MKYPVEKERWNPTMNSLSIIDNAIGNISANISTLHEWFNSYSRSHRIRLAFDLDYVDRFALPENLILEVGAIPFILTLGLMQKNYRVVALDISPNRMQNLIDTYKIQVKTCDIETQSFPFEDNTFDMILFNEVFEHLRINPIHTLNEVYRVLKPGGKLLLSTPNLTSFKGWYSLLLQNKTPNNVYYEYKKLMIIGHMGHVREYTATEICEFLGHIGFTIERLIYRGVPQSKMKWKQFTASFFLTIFPHLRRYFTVVARK